MEWCRMIAPHPGKIIDRLLASHQPERHGKGNSGTCEDRDIDPMVGILAKHEGKHDDRHYRTHVGRHPYRGGAASDSFGNLSPNIRARVKERGAIYGYHALTDEQRPPCCVHLGSDGHHLGRSRFI